jgi:hypothetical protein
MGVIIWIVVIAALVFVAGLALGHYRNNSSAGPAGSNSQNITPWGRLYAQRRADHSKGENWFSRPIISSENRNVRFFPKSDNPDDPKDASDPKG